jgi:hypothetical protein
MTSRPQNTTLGPLALEVSMTDQVPYMYLYANCRLPNQLVDFD